MSDGDFGQVRGRCAEVRVLKRKHYSTIRAGVQRKTPRFDTRGFRGVRAKDLGYGTTRKRNSTRVPPINLWARLRKRARIYRAFYSTPRAASSDRCPTAAVENAFQEVAFPRSQIIPAFALDSIAHRCVEPRTNEALTPQKVEGVHLEGAKPS